MALRDSFARRHAHFAAANASHPDARRAERDHLLDLIDPRPGARICDLQSASGFVARGIRERWGETVQVVSVEPSPSLARTLPPADRPVNASLEALPLVGECTDFVVSLAGTHHSPDLASIAREAWRVLRPGGVCALCEVERGTPMDRWLNEFVDSWTSDGHDGHFVAPGELSEALHAAGFVGVREERAAVPWRFSSVEEMVTFCRTLFGLGRATPEVVLEGIHKHLELDERESLVVLEWSLLYARAERP